MGRPDIRCGKLSVAPGVSTRHQVSDDDVPASGPDERRVFEKDPFRSNSVNCSDDLSVEPASLAVDACAASGGADVLTREASAKRIDASQLSREVHGAHVTFDDAQPGEALAQDGAGIGIPLDGDNGLMPEDEVGEDSAAGSGEEMAGAHVSMPPPKTAPAQP